MTNPTNHQPSTNELSTNEPSTVNSFLNCYREWHALIIGFFEVLCPWPPRFKLVSQDLTNQVANEYHYYLFGRAVGVLAWLTIGSAIAILLT